MRSKSLEGLSSLAMWEPHVEEVVLKKGEKGLGFSILDYQVNNADLRSTSEHMNVTGSFKP